MAVSTTLDKGYPPERNKHPLRALTAQRPYGLCCGNENLNDHDRLRHDPLMQTVVCKVDGLASAPTLSRLETRATRADVAALSRVLVEQFIAAHKQAPAELVLDVDASVVPLHSEHELAQFHGYFDCYGYLPLYVFCGQAMHACVLRPSRIDAAKQAAALIRLRQAWPQVRIIERGDSGFCRQRLLRLCERQGSIRQSAHFLSNSALATLLCPHRGLAGLSASGW